MTMPPNGTNQLPLWEDETGVPGEHARVLIGRNDTHYISHERHKSRNLRGGDFLTIAPRNLKYRNTSRKIKETNTTRPKIDRN